MAVNDNITLNRIFDIFKQLAGCHKQLADFSVGDVATRGHKKDNNELTPERSEMKFPYLWIDPTGVVYDIGNSKQIVAKNYLINIFVADKHQDNSFNDEEILSDTEGILSDLIQWILTNPELRSFTTNVTTLTPQPARHATRDEVFGWEVVFTIRVPYKFCYSNLPIETK